MAEFDGGWTRQRPDSWEEDDGAWGATEEPKQAPTQHLFEKLIKTEAVWFVGGLAVLGAAFYGTVSNIKGLSNNLKPKAAPPVPLVASCPQPSRKSISTVERLFTEPVAKARAEYRQLPLDGYEAEGSDMLPNLFGTSGDALLYYTKSYFAKYGIEVNVASAADNPGYGLRPPTEKEFNSSYMSNNVLGIAAGLSYVAPHYVIDSGLRKILLVAGGDKTEFVWNEPHTLYWNINTPQPNLDGVPFEFGIALGHFTEERLCSIEGANTDQAFQAASNGPFASPLMPSGSIYGSDGQAAKHVATLEEYHEGKVNAADVAVIDSRATENLSADKAEILALIAAPFRVWSAMSPDHPILRKKVITTLAELYREQPAVVRRLAIKAAQDPYKNWQHPVPAGSRYDTVFEDPRS